MYFFKNIVILLLILQINKLTQIDCLEDSGFFSNIGKFMPKIGSSETKATSPPPKKSNWMPDLPNFMKKNEETKKEEAKSSWFPKVLGLVLSKDLKELPSNDISSKVASKKNLSISSSWSLVPNLNFSNFNLSNWEMVKWNTTNFLSFNSNRDWFVSMKAKHYENLLGNKTFFTYNSSNTSSFSNDAINNLNKNSINNSVVNSVDNSSSNYNINFNLFRDRLFKVYDNLTFCEHPCNDGRLIKKSNSEITINGCGPSYFSERQLSLIPYGEYFKQCCNVHDTNYSECGFKKQEADYNFLDCMLDLINQTSLNNKYAWPRVQKTFGYALFGMVDIFGCKAYSISQKEVCSCS